MKVVINRCWGGFGLSDEAQKELGVEPDIDQNGKEEYYGWAGERNDPKLVAIVEKMGDKANGNSSGLKVVEIPDDVDWYIDDYDGMETIREKHRTWN